MKISKESKYEIITRKGVYFMDAMKKQSVENANIERASLAKTLGRGDVWALAFGSIVGWGWVMLAGS